MFEWRRVFASSRKYRKGERGICNSVPDTRNDSPKATDGELNIPTEHGGFCREHSRYRSRKLKCEDCFCSFPDTAAFIVNSLNTGKTARAWILEVSAERTKDSGPNSTSKISGFHGGKILDYSRLGYDDMQPCKWSPNLGHFPIAKTLLVLYLCSTNARIRNH
jgi:hypothetical protein